MKTLTPIILMALSISLSYAQNANSQQFQTPAGLVNAEPGDHKVGRFLVSFKKRYVAGRRKFACGPACDAAGHFIDTTIDFDQIRLFTLADKQVLLQRVADNANKWQCKLNTRPREIDNHWRVFTKENLFTYKPYNLAVVTDPKPIHAEALSGQTKQNLPSSDTILTKVTGQFCIKDRDIYFTQVLGDSLRDEAFKVLAIADKE